MIFDLVTLTFQVVLLKKNCPGLWLESEGLLIVAIYIWLPPASYVVFSDNSGCKNFPTWKIPIYGIVIICFSQTHLVFLVDWCSSEDIQQRGCPWWGGALRSVMGASLFKKHALFSLQIDVAVKTFHEEGALAGALSSIMEEARLMQKLDHHCIVKLYGICESPFMLVRYYIF